MKKLILSTCVLLVCVICLHACTYNGIMKDHLSDADNYKTYQVVLQKTLYFDSRSEMQLYVTFASREELAPFLGVSPESISEPIDSHEVRLQICAENHQLLKQSGFYDDVEAGDEITVTTSDWIYMDGEFFYVIGVSVGEQVYLDPTVGLQNVIDMMQ